MALVAGIDSSTQSTKVLLCHAEDGTVAGTGSAPHPAGTECDPEAWWAAVEQAGSGLLDRAAAIAVAGQQHGMLVLDADGTGHQARAAVERSALVICRSRARGRIRRPALVG